ncbi:MAG TPA: hypothetical protein VJV22_05190 [Acidobacteriaceae bacterium]|nr:hypothetical protein [Acidobacteriaceae bacterium]
MRSPLLPLLLALLSSPALATAQAGYQPQPVPMPPPIPAPQDTPYPGTIAVQVNLTNMTDRVAAVHEEIPVKSGDVTLLYPEWIPGNHSPTGPIENLGGLVVTGNGQRIPWVRDRVNVYAFHIDVPKGISTLSVDFDYLSPVMRQEGRIQFSSKLADLAWNTVVLYPAGHFSRDIHFTPTIVLPHGWKFATALETESQDGDTVHFKDTTLNTLIDSPLVAGEYFKRLDLSTGPDNPVHLDVFADEAKDLEVTPE